MSEKPIFDWKCPECESTDVILMQSCSRGMNNMGEIVKMMVFENLFYKCQECDKEWY